MAQKKVVSIRLAEEQVEYLYRTARRLGRTPSQTAALLIEDAQRRERYPEIEMRDTLAGRIAYIRRTRLPVWMMADRMWRGMTPEEVAENLGPEVVNMEQMRSALAYAEEFRDEIEQDIEDDQLADERLKELPGYTELTY